MKTSVVRRIVKEDLTRAGDVPSWVDALLAPLNQFIDLVGLALTNRLSFADNFAATEISQSFTHNVETQVNPQSSAKVTGIIVTDTGGQILTGYGYKVKNNGNLGITLKFDAGGSTKATCKVVILLG